MSNEQSDQHENNDVDVVAVEKINNTKSIPPTEMSVPYPINQKFNEMLEQLIPNHKERTEKKQQVINNVFMRGINSILDSIQQHQQQQCFFVEKGKTPRPQVLENYTKLAFVLEIGSIRKYGEKFLRNTIKRTLNVTDKRTVTRYLLGILNYSTKLSHTSGYNVAGFCDSFSESLKCKAGQNLEDYI